MPEMITTQKPMSIAKLTLAARHEAMDNSSAAPTATSRGGPSTPNGIIQSGSGYTCREDRKLRASSIFATPEKTKNPPNRTRATRTARPLSASNGLVDRLTTCFF
jgi:hypothetical protein